MKKVIKNKLDSDFQIKKRGLNHMLEGLFTESSTYEDLMNFLNENKYDYYNIRDKSVAAGKFMYKITRDNVLKESKNYKKYAVYESLALADNKLILQGDIEIDNNFIMKASLSNIKGISNRIAMQEPVYNLYEIDLKENKEPYIEGLNKVLDYIISNELIGMVVEFSLFDIPVGVNHEKIIIWELRNY